MSDEIKVKTNSGKTKLVIAILAVIIIALTITAILLLPKQGKAKKVAKQLSLGAKYLSELEYEQAIAAYELAIEIDPKCVDAYLELADVYSELGEYDKAEEILKKAKREVAEEDVAQIRRKQEKIEKKREEAEGTPEPTTEPKPTAEPVQTPEPTAKPTPAPTATPTPTPTPAPTATPTPEPTKSVGSRVTITGRTVELENASVGDYVTFGTYEQDNDLGNGAEAIEWLVLEKKDGKALLLSKYALDAKPYNKEFVAVTWATCTLRSWLNNEFYTTAFTEKERTSIAETLVRNDDNTYYGTEGGNDTRDKVFLLSIEEVTTYFDSDPDAEDPARRVKVTEYAKAQGGLCFTSDEYYGNGWWWLRSPGNDSPYAAVLNYFGPVDRRGHLVGCDNEVVRPALWIAYEPTETEPTATPTPETTATPKPTATPAPTKSASLDSVQAISKASVGDYVTFGTYEQDNNLGNGAEAIEWLVLEKKDGKALLLSKYALDAKAYNEEEIDVTWETCTLRSWLNNEFYTTAFTEKERTSIVETLVRNADNPERGTEGGNDTRDKVFLLSIEEVTTYFDSDPDAYDSARRAKVTEYAKAQEGIYSIGGEYYGWWWLRSPGYYCDNAAGVDGLGLVDRYGINVDGGSLVVRPALWIAY